MQTFVGNGCGLFTILRWLLGLQHDRIKDPAQLEHGHTMTLHVRAARSTHELYHPIVSLLG